MFRVLPLSVESLRKSLSIDNKLIYDMRVLLLSTGGKIGGEETFTRGLAESLLRQGHSVEIAVGGEVQKKDLEDRGISICPIDITSRALLGIISAAKKLALYIKSNQIDIVHAQAIGPAIMGVCAKKLFGCTTPWIWHNHGIGDFAYKHIVRHLNALDGIIANSDYVREMLKAKGVENKIIYRIHNGISTDDFGISSRERDLCKQKLTAEIGVGLSTSIVGYIGRLSKEKGVEVLIKAMKTLLESKSTVHCVLIGDGDERESLKKLSIELGIESRMHFLGFRRDIRELLGGIDVLVLPSHMETFSLTTLQAFASETPCVGSDVGGTPEQILDKFNGLLFEDNNHIELAQNLDIILENQELREYLSSNAKALCFSYLNVDRMTTDIESVYIKVTDRK